MQKKNTPNIQYAPTFNNFNFNLSTAIVIYDTLASEPTGWPGEFFPYKFLLLDPARKYDTTRTSHILAHSLVIPLTLSWGNTEEPKLWGTMENHLSTFRQNQEITLENLKGYFFPPWRIKPMDW